jgi:hypothetical protein
MSALPALPGRLLLLALLLIMAEVVLNWTGTLLPVQMASHFDAGGRADGSASRTQYLLMMSVILAALPLATLGACWAATCWPNVFLNLPNREHWLSPGHWRDTRRRLRVFAADLAVLQAVFLLAVHLWVVMANLGKGLSGAWIWLAAIFLLVALVSHIIGLIRYFQSR